MGPVDRHHAFVLFVSRHLRLAAKVLPSATNPLIESIVLFIKIAESRRCPICQSNLGKDKSCGMIGPKLLFIFSRNRIIDALDLDI